MDQHSASAVVVGSSLAGARTVASQGSVGAESAYRIASLTKTVTSAALTATLLRRGIPLSTRAIELLACFEGDWHADRGLTVEQILGQVSGLRESVDAATAAALGAGSEALEAAARLVVRAGSEAEPGRRWSYYNGNYFLAGAILARLTGTSFETALNATILHPWNLTRTGFATPSDPVLGETGPEPEPPTDYPRTRRPSGGLWSCVRDLLAFGEHLVNEPQLMEAVRTPVTRPDSEIQYGLGWALGRSGQLYVNGRLPGYRNAMLIVPDIGFVGVVLTNQTYALPAAAQLLSDLQKPYTGDDLVHAIDAFAA